MRFNTLFFNYSTKKKMQENYTFAAFSSTQSKRLFSVILFALLTSFALQAQTIRYVKETATGTGDGSSWANASADLQAMINASGTGSQVWVAAGTYTPTRDAYGNATPSNPRSKTFYVRDGVKIYGGFSASTPETTLAARAITTNVTTLSGNNAYHVVLASSANAFWGLGVTVDGFTITGGFDNFDGSSITVNGNQIFNSSGSAISLNYGVNTISNNTFTGNYSEHYGGAIFTNNGTNSITNNTFKNNSVQGGIYDGAGAFNITLIGGGGAICTYNGTNSISNNTFSENFSENYGAAILTHYGSNTISNNTLHHNRAYYGGAIYFRYGTNALNNNTLHTNTATVGGGAIYAKGDPSNGSATISGNNIYNNIAYNGGAVETNTSYVNFVGNIVYNNYANHWGGAFLIAGRPCTWQNNTISNNKAQWGGAIYFDSYSGNTVSANGHSLTNNTIVSNTANYGGGGIYNYFSSQSYTNNIFWGNKKNGSTNEYGADFDNFNMTNYYGTISNPPTGYVYGKCVFKNNLLQLPIHYYNEVTFADGTVHTNTLHTGSSGNIFNQDPKFVLPEVIRGFDGQFRTVDDGLALQAGSSPCINAGTWSAAPSSDIRGTARVWSPDIGAYENALSCVTPTLYTLTGAGTYCAGTTGLALGLSGSEIGVTYQLRNTSNNLVGSPVNGTGAAINFGTFRNGTYSVLAIRTNGGCQATMSGSGVVTATACCPSGSTLYVNATVTGGTYDGSTWANAYTNLSEALFAAHNCSGVKTIKIASGTYYPSMKPFNNGVEITTTDARDYTFHVPDGVTIEGGYDASTGNRLPSFGGVGGGTILSGDIGKLDDSNDNAYHVVLSSANSATGVGITIDGFTIKAGNANGSSDITVNANAIGRSSGAAIVTNYGVNTISNNTITGNSAASVGGGISTNAGTNTINNNVISGNSASAGGGISTNAGTNTISNNTISGNSASVGGGGIYANAGTNTIGNNTISGNSTAEYGGGISINYGTNIITENAIIGNYAYDDYEYGKATIGGGIYILSGANTITNNLIYGNEVYSYDGGSYGGGVYVSGSTNTVVNNTFSQNRASTGTYDYDPEGGAIYILAGNIFNNIFWGNRLDSYADSYIQSTNYLMSSNNSFTNDPLFVDYYNPAGADGIYGTNDDGLRLQESSILIDAGKINGAPNTDIRGVSRLNIPDLGAYENVYSCATIDVYDVTGAGSYCVGATSNLAVGLSNSQIGVSYQLIEGVNTNIGSPVNGTGAAISFGNQPAGHYTILATKTDNSCKASMRGVASIIEFACCTGGNTLYVNASVSGGTGEGSSWANAYSSLSDALFAAHSCGLVKTIKVAAGTYKPTRKPLNNGVEMTEDYQGVLLSSRLKTFHIPDGVTILGGYDAATDSRNISANVTTLSGDLDGDDIIDANGAISSGNTNNANSVVMAAGNTGVTIDGFYITGGNANVNSFTLIFSNSYFYYNDFGGGIFIDRGTNTITNNTLYNNSASAGGGGFYSHRNTNIITNNTLYNNSASGGGGGFFIGGDSYTEDFGACTISNNVIYNNSTTGFGGGFGIDQYNNRTISNNVIYNNSATGTGGGIWINHGAGSITNNTFYNNSAIEGGGLFMTGTYSTKTNTLTNNIFRANKKGTSATVAGADFFNETGAKSFINIFKNNLLQLASSNYPATGNYGISSSASGNLFNQNPLFVSTTNFAGADAKHRTIDDGLRLQSTSPCVNKGIATGAPTTDITGANRVGLPDVGAYEYFIPCTPPSAFTVTGGGALCAGDDGGAAIGLSNSVTGVTYQLKDGTTNVGTALSGTGAALNFGNHLTAGTYTVVATITSSGCTATMTGTATISINAIPNVTINVGNTCGKSVLTASITSPSGVGGTYLWSNDATTAKNTVTDAGTYSVTATVAGGCSATASAIAAPSALPSITVTVTNNCGNSLLAASATGVGALSYEWSKTIKTASTTVTTAGTYTVNVTDAATGCKGSASVVAAPKVVPKPFILVSNNCGNSVLNVRAPFLGVGSTYLWSNGETTADITVSSAGFYTATVSSTEGCTAVTSAEVTPKEVPTASVSVTDNCGNSVLSASATPALGVGGTYLWSNGATTSDITLIATGVGGAATYTVTLTNSEDCSTTVSSTATLKIDPTIYMVTGGGTYCAGLEGLEVGLSGSQTGVSYQLQKDNVNVGTAITGTGAAISFGKQMGAGTYSVIGTHIISACMNTMLSPKTIAIDETLPAFVTASVPTNLTINCSDAIPAAATPSATNSCSTVSMSETSTKGTDATQCSFYSYAITRTWTATDKRSNTATVSQVITVQDKTAPVIATLANITVTEAMLASVTSATATDCSPRTATFTDVKVTVTPPACYTYRTNITRTWLVSDACGNTATKSQLIVSQGLTLACPANKTFNTNADGTSNYNCSTVIKASDNVNPAFLDNCNTSVLKYTLSGATVGLGNGTIAGLAFNKGVTTVTYGVQAAQIDACFFTVTVNDSEAPKFGTVSNSVIDACNIPNPITMTAPSATDNCSGVISVTPSMDVTANVSGCASKAAMLKYTKSVTRTWIAADVAGNTSTAVQRMYIRDMQAPTAICKDIIVTIGSSNISVLATQINNGSSDNCTATAALSYAICRNIGIVCTYASGLSLTPSMIPTGSNFANIPVTLRVTDACGNIGTCTATIRLQRISTLANGNTNDNNATDLSITSDSKEELGATPATPSTIDATHGSLKCFPNPFSDNLNLEYNLAKAASKVTLKVYDNQGRLVTSSEQGEQLEGFYQINWNLSDLQSGMYHVCLEIDGKCTKVERVIRLQ